MAFVFAQVSMSLDGLDRALMPADAGAWTLQKIDAFESRHMVHLRYRIGARE